MEQTADLAMMLAAREKRALRQTQMLSRHHLPLVSFSMNIAGPVKNSPLIRRGFALGRRRLLEQIRLSGGDIAEEEETDAPTGCEGLYAVRMDAQALKRLTCRLEEALPLGRLYDMDVISADGVKLDRPFPRRCLICGKPARDCARSRAHSVEELQRVTRAMLQNALNEHDAQTASALAARALLYEVAVSPKPGLVDRFGPGSHRDMDFYTFQSSVSALWPYFSQCVLTGRQTASLPAPQTLAALRVHGLLAEGDMLRATGNVNTHKGAVYSMGLLCGALGRLKREDWTKPDRILREISLMATGTVEQELARLPRTERMTAGQRIYADYGIAGVRGEAEKGFPTVLDRGLPALEKCLREGRTVDEAGCAALLELIASTPDTNMIARGGMKKSREAAARAEETLRLDPCPGRDALEDLDASFTADRLSPGGSADLLALCFMLHFLRKEPTD